MRAFPFLAAFAITAIGFGDEPSVAGRDQAVELANRVLRVIDTVVEKHIDPPTRQSLAQAFCTTVSPTTRRPLGFGRAFSFVDDDQMRSILAEQIASINETTRPAVVHDALARVLLSEADTTMAKRSEQRVNDQISANRYVGIGIALGMPDETPTMMQVFEDGPADRGGAKKGDRILHVDGTRTTGIKLTAVIDMLRGPAGSQVEIGLAGPGEKERTLILTRDVVPFKHVKDFKVIEPGIATVRINSITGSIVRDLRRLTPRIIENEIKGIVLQLESQETSYRPALMFANALIDGEAIGGIESERAMEPVTADTGTLWPGVYVAITHRPFPQDALAWAIESLRHHGVYVDNQMTGTRIQPVQHAWRYSQVEMPESEYVLVLPTARLLTIRTTSDGKQDYADLVPQTAIRGPSVAVEEKMVRSRQQINGLKIGSNWLTRSIDILRQRIAQGG